jgi:hypothetical protein
MKKIFKYCTDIPIKVKTENIPKYRLFFGTNHMEGLFLMIDQMNKAWKKIISESRENQGVLFNYEFPKYGLSEGFNLEDDIINILKKQKMPLLVGNVVCELIVGKYGITFSTSEYKKKIKAMDGNKIIIHRNPEYTETGRKAFSMDFDEYEITLEMK